MSSTQTVCDGVYLGFVLAVGGKMLQVPVTVCVQNTQQSQSFKSESSQQSRLILSRHSLIHLLHRCLNYRRQDKPDGLFNSTSPELQYRG